jgi:hypothetical protein
MRVAGIGPQHEIKKAFLKGNGDITAAQIAPTAPRGSGLRFTLPL